MTTTATRVAFGISELIFLALLTLLVPILTFVDVASTGHSLSEISFTEITQESLLPLSILGFGYTAFTHPDSRSFLVLVTGFFPFPHFFGSPMVWGTENEMDRNKKTLILINNTRLL